MYCVKCGVELADSEKSCPLCGTEVILPRNVKRELADPPYPPYPGAVTEGFSRSGVMSLITLLCLIPFTLCLIVDLKINGEIVATADTTITVYNEWHTVTIENIEYTEGDTIVVGIYVKCAGPNAWGKIDDAMLNSVKE